MVNNINILAKINGKTENISFKLKGLNIHLINNFSQFVDFKKEKNDRNNYLHIGKHFNILFSKDYNEAYQKLIRCTKREEVIEIIDKIIDNRRSYEYYSDDEIIYVSILTIIRLYIKNKYNNKEIIINKIKEQPDDLFDALEELPESTKENGLYDSIKKIFLDNLPKVFINDVSHKCLVCDRLLNCEKIRDVVKKDINKYPFIKSGYQQSINDNPDIFIVNECDDYYKDKGKDNTYLTQSKKVKKNNKETVVNNKFSFIDYKKIKPILKKEYDRLYNIVYFSVNKNYRYLYNKLILCDNINDVKKLLLSNESDCTINNVLIYELEKNTNLIIDIFTRVVIEIYYAKQYGTSIRIDNIFNNNIKYPHEFIETGMYNYAKEYCTNVLESINSTKKLTRKNI